ncbi:hypothetical protein LBMAG42_50790 [Deltaproteobacteria bacterium]|nr:hypothetical protein LBMAG42_50790 [Deltaproteobacteria bacterium]
MDWSTLGQWGWLAIGIAGLGLPLQIILGFAIAAGRRVPVVMTIFAPVTVIVLGLVGVSTNYTQLQRALWDAADPAWTPWYTFYDRAEAAAPAPLAGMMAFGLVVPTMVGAAVSALRQEKRGNIGPLFAATGGLLSGMGLVVVGMVIGRPALAVPGLLLALLALLAAGGLAAIRPRYLAIPGIGVAGFLVAALGLVITTLAGLELDVTDILDDLLVAHTRVGALAAHEGLARSAALAVLILPTFAVAALLPGLGFVRAKDQDARQGLDIAASGALLGGAVMAVAWVLVKRSMLGRLAGAHAAWVLAAAPGYDVPRRDVLPPRVLIPGDPVSQWVELRDGGGAGRESVVGTANEVGHGLRQGDGVLMPASWTAEDLYLLLVDAPAGNIALVGCAPVSPSAALQIKSEPLLALGRCGSFPLKLRVASAMPNPRELILVPGKFVQDGLDVIELRELQDIAGRDVILRIQTDSTLADILAALDALSPAATVYLGWGVTTDGDDLAIGVEPGLRVVEGVPTPAGTVPVEGVVAPGSAPVEGAVAPAPVAAPAPDAASVMAVP